MLWVLFVGGVAAGVRPERDWFISYLSTFMDDLDLQSWEQTESVLRNFLWPKAWQDLGHVLWVQLQEARTTSRILPLAVDKEPLVDYPGSLGFDDKFAGE